MEIKITAAFGERLVTDLNSCFPKTVFAQNMAEPHEFHRANGNKPGGIPGLVKTVAEHSVDCLKSNRTA